MKKEPDLDKALGIAMKSRREGLGLSQSELAEKAKVSQSWISLVENAKRGKHPSLKVLRRISLALELVSLSSLINRVEAVAYGPNMLDQARTFVYDAKE